MKVQLFNFDHTGYASLHKWLEGKKDIDIHFIKQSESGVNGYGWSFTISIFYTEKPGKPEPTSIPLPGAPISKPF